MLKEQTKIEELVIKYDKELNKQYNLIQSIKSYCMKTHMTIEEYENLIEMIDNSLESKT